MYRREEGGGGGRGGEEEGKSVDPDEGLYYLPFIYLIYHYIAYHLYRLTRQVCAVLVPG